MLFKFRFGKTLVEYQVEFDYDNYPFDFDIRNDVGFLYNATLIERRLATIDRVHFYRLIANNSVDWNGSNFYLDGSIQYYASGTQLNWNVRQHYCMTDTAYAAIDAWKTDIKPVVIGTMTAHRDQLHAEVKQAIRDRARRQATKMRDNAKIILQYLDELEGPGSVIIDFGDTEPKINRD